MPSTVTPIPIAIVGLGPPAGGLTARCLPVERLPLLGLLALGLLLPDDLLLLEGRLRVPLRFFADPDEAPLEDEAWQDEEAAPQIDEIVQDVVRRSGEARGRAGSVLRVSALGAVC